MHPARTLAAIHLSELKCTALMFSSSCFQNKKNTLPYADLQLLEGKLPFVLGINISEVRTLEDIPYL